jgi:hypothetical protein
MDSKLGTFLSETKMFSVTKRVNLFQDVDVVITFPPDCSESTIFWFKERIETIPGISLKIKSMALTRDRSNKTFFDRNLIIS